MAKPHVAVLLATYNGSAFIREFLDSLCAQTCTEFKLFVRDDGSQDDTLEVLRAYSPSIDICFIEDDRRLGPAKSFMELLVRAGDGFDFYFFADQDDYWAESKLERAAGQLAEKSSQSALYCSRLEYVDEHLVHIKYSRIPRAISLGNALVENIATGCTIAINRSARELIVGHLPSNMIMHDWWCYIVVAAFGSVVYDDFPTIKYRQHGNNTIGAATTVLQDFKKRWIRFIKKDGGIFGLSTQMADFKRCYSAMLTAKQLSMVDEILDAKVHVSQRLFLAFSRNFFRQRWIDTLILRALFLLGRF